MFKIFDISGSGMTAQRLRMDTIANNLANAETTRTQEGTPYRRQTVILQANQNQDFASVLKDKQKPIGAGVKVTQIAEDSSPFKQVYNPSHPDADENGYVSYPNVDAVTEMVNMISASRSYEANAQSVNVAKDMFLKALNIGN